MPKQQKAAQEPPAAPDTLTRAAVAEQLEQRLAGKLSDVRLAKWAFDSFYAIELGETEIETGVEELVSDLLDALMFGDEPGFRLSEDELRSWASRLAAAGKP